MTTKLTPTEVSNLVNDVLRGFVAVDCEVVCTRYTGVGHAERNDKRIAILSAVDYDGVEFSALVGDKGSRGPALLKSGSPTDLRPFKTTASFNLRKAGYPHIESEHFDFGDSKTLWRQVFAEHHANSHDAKLLFLRLIGLDVSDAAEAVPSPNIGSVLPDAADPPFTPRKKFRAKTAEPTAPPPHPYAGNRLWGTL